MLVTRLDQPERGRQHYAFARTRLAAVHGDPGNLAFLVIDYYIREHGIAIFSHLAEASHDPDEVADLLLQCRTMHAEQQDLADRYEQLFGETMVPDTRWPRDLTDPDWLDLRADAAAPIGLTDDQWMAYRLWFGDWLQDPVSTEMALVWFGHLGDHLQNARADWVEPPFPLVAVESQNPRWGAELLIPVPAEKELRRPVLAALRQRYGHDFVRARNEPVDELMQRAIFATSGDGDLDADIGAAEVENNRYSKPEILEFVSPEYPITARLRNAQGTVIVKVLIDPAGDVIDAVILQGVDEELDAASLAAARQARYRPGKFRDIPIKAWMAIPYKFRLHEKEAAE